MEMLEYQEGWFHQNLSQWFLFFLVPCLLQYTRELNFTFAVFFPSAALMIAFIMETYGLTYR